MVRSYKKINLLPKYWGTLALLIFSTALLQAQALDVTVSSPSEAGTCGPLVSIEITVDNNSGAGATGVEGAFTFPTGVTLVGVNTPATLTAGTVSLGNIPNGESVTFTADIQVNCEISTENFNYTFDITAGGMGTNTSDNIQVVFADLSIPSSNPTVLGVYDGLTTSIQTSVINNGFGDLTEFTYCVSNNIPTLSIQQILVGTVDITAGGPAPSSTATQNCYVIDEAALNSAGVGPILELESIPITETWLVDGCASDPPDILRRAQYGCQGDDDCQGKEQSDFTATGVSYSLLLPDIDIAVASATRPACYVDDPSVVTMTFTNNGTAPAKDIRFRIFTDGSRGMTIDMGSFLVDSVGTLLPAPAVTSQTAATDCRAPGIRDAELELQDVNLGIGESLTVTYSLNASCGCNSCDIRNKYWHRFRLTGYDDLCDVGLTEEQNIEPLGRFDAFIRGFPEAPTTINDGATGCVTYFATDMQLDWLTSAYPNSYLEAIFNIECGLDVVPGSFSFTDRDGQSFTIDPANVSVTPGAADSETLTVRMLPTGRPGGFNYAGGAQFEFCVQADCSEKPPPGCGTAFYDVNIDAQFDFTTDPSCAAPCAIQKIWDPADISARIVCPPDPTCPPCDGIRFRDLTVERVNFGIGDSNNDQVPDGVLDLSKVETGRYLQGDSLKVTLQGTVQDVDDSQDFDYGFVTFPVGHENYSPLGAVVEIFDSSDGNMRYECTAVPITPEYTGATSRIIVDYSREALNNFGCGLPAGFLFEEGDSIAICLLYVEKDLITDQFLIRDYEPQFYLSEDEFGVGGVFQCNPLFGRMTQIGFSTFFEHSNNNFGACEQSGWRTRYDRNIGGRNTDEFPCEIRTIGLPGRYVFTKPSEFGFRLDNWQIRLRQEISPANDIVNWTTIPPQYLVVNGDEVTVLAEDFFNSLGLSEVPPDEGYRFEIRPRIQGNCESIEDPYSYSFQLFESVDENIFCIDEIARPLETRTFDYQGAARLVVISELENIRLCSGNDVARILVQNETNPAASNSFLYPEPTGGVIITSILDVASNTIIPPNAFGIYELGNIPGGSERILEVQFTKNSCDNEQLDFIAGWDCLGYPETINDAICTDPSSVSLTSANSNSDMIVIMPATSETIVIDLCDPVPYTVEFISTDLGYVRDMVMTFSLPPNQTYVPGSFQIAIPAPPGGALVAAIDPTPLGGNQYQIDISSLDPVLDTEGLVGSKDQPNSRIQVQFLAETECGYISGSRTSFLLESKNSCGDPLPPINRQSGRIRVRPDEPTIDVDVLPNDLILNACNEEQATITGMLTIVSGTVSSLDSIRMVLPIGIEYVMDSYVPGMNAFVGNNPPIIQMINGQTVLSWPMETGLDAGDVVTFDLDIRAVDAGQACAESDLIIQAFTSFEEECRGMICTVGEASGEGAQQITIQKADLDFNFIDGSITLDAASGNAMADFTVKVTNFGFPLDAGNEVRVDIYEDVNNNGSFDEGTDIFLFPVSTTITDPLNTGECLVINDQATFPATNICTVIGVLDPDNTCTCSELPSSTFRPEIIYAFPMEYDVCSGETVNIGPMPIAGYTFEWLSLNGSDLGNISPTDNTPSVFTAPINATGAPLTLQYVLRSSNAPCFADDTVSVTIAPQVMDVVNVNACMGTSYDLPTVTDPNASNFVWSPTTGLTISPDGRYATVDNVSASTTYTLTYEIGGGGCPASQVVNVNALNCGGAVTELGNYVWFDFNEDGVQDAGEFPIEGVVVNLIDANTGTVISTTTTDNMGLYLFDNLPAGNYAVEFIPLPGFVFTTNDTGTTDGDDSDADPVTGITPARFLPLDEQDYTFDAGFIPNCSLDISVDVSDCVPDGSGGLTREYIITVDWMNNPYTYDQFGDGQDIIDINFMGNTYMVTATELDGTSTLSVITSNMPGPFTATAAFQEATACTASTDVGPFTACNFDLALKKEASSRMPTPGPYSYGDLICMDIVVFNQGDQTVTNVQVQDMLPPGMLFNPANSIGWSNIDPVQLFIIPGPIASGMSDTATICVNLQMTGGGVDDYTNIAEITSFADANGNDRSAFDEDSTPDNDFANDTGGNPDDATNDEVNDDGTNDEDDNDPFKVEVFDLGLTKQLLTPPFYAVGDTVTYQIEVTNQGNIPAQDIRVLDYIPDGFTFLASNMPPWETLAPLDTDFDTTGTMIPGVLAPGATAQLSIMLQLDGVPGQTNYINRAEISKANDEDGNPGEDIDSTPDTDPTDDAGGVPMSDSDNTLSGNGTGNPGDTDEATDEDDHDPELLSIDSVSIGSTIFIDDNNNGLQDLPTDMGISGVTVELLLDANGNGMIDPGETTPIATTMTNANGDYYFGMLLPGNYVVQIPTVNYGSGEPLEMLGVSSIPTNTLDDATDGDDNGIQSGAFTTVRSPVIELIPTTEALDTDETAQGGTLDTDNGQADANGNMTVDFGFIPSNVSIGSTVFADYDDSGIQDAGEPGIPFVDIQLFYDANNDGMVDAAEMTTPFTTGMTDANGDYYFDRLIPGNYVVAIPTSSFTSGNGLEFLPTSSTDIGTTTGDNQTDGDDNGIQTGGAGTLTLSPVIRVFPTEEPTNATGETEQGNDQDDIIDDSGDMTIDFGFICNPEVEIEDAVIDLCSSRRLDVDMLSSITPNNLNGTWITSGSGMFLDADGNLVSPARYRDVVFYVAGPGDIAAGEVILTLMSDPAGVCPPLMDQITVRIARVGCGGFPWNGD